MSTKAKIFYFAVVLLSIMIYQSEAAAEKKMSCMATAVDGTCYGHELKKKDFLLADGFINLNHGSFGTGKSAVCISVPTPSTN